MYKYKLSNNHYIIKVEGKNFLLDTGCNTSFSLKKNLHTLTIKGCTYYLPYNRMNINLEDLHKLVGMDVDGFIGNDVLYDHSITIHKDGRVDFKAAQVDGHKFPIVYSCAGIKIKLQGEGFYVIDTGAKYSYGVKKLFSHKEPFDHIEDYAPRFGWFESDIYHCSVKFDGLQKTIAIADSELIEKDLKWLGTTVIGNITDLFDEVCVIDMRKRIVTLK